MSVAKEPKHSPIFLILLLLMFLLIFIFMSGDLFRTTQSPEILTLPTVLGILGVLFVLLALIRLLGRFPSPAQRITLTVLQCAKCALKNIRDFQVGDYISKLAGTCPSCGGPFFVEQIYMEEKTSKRKITG